MSRNPHQNGAWVPKGWEREVWRRVERIANNMSKAELIAFYHETGAVQADDLTEWSKEELLGVLDEIGKDDAIKLIEQYKHDRL